MPTTPMLPFHVDVTSSPPVGAGHVRGLDLHLDVADRRGRGRSLEDALRDAVRSGRLPPGTRLPGTRSLAADLGLSRGTVVQVFGQLVAEGWLVGVAGSGTTGDLPTETRDSPADGAGPRRVSHLAGRVPRSAARLAGCECVAGRGRGGRSRSAARWRPPSAPVCLHGLPTGGYWHRPAPDRPGALVIGYATPAAHAWRRALDALTDLLPC